MKGSPASLSLKERILVVVEQTRSQLFQELESAAEEAESEGLLKVAISRWEDVLRIEPLHEGAYREIIRLYLRLGDQTMALKAYRRLETVLEESFSPPARPTSKTRRLIESVPILRYALSSGMPLPA